MLHVVLAASALIFVSDKALGTTGSFCTLTTFPKNPTNSLVNFSLNINAIDGAIVIAYLVAVLLFGLWIGRGQQNSADYFLGGRSLPWWALLFSIVATETSTVTFLSIPGKAFASENGNMAFLQITIGYLLGRLAVVTLLLPLYFRGEPFTAYEVLESRFGKATRRAASLLFLITRNVSDALRLFLTALVLQVVLGLDLSLCVITLGIITILYTFVGGAKSVIWNDCVQFLVYMLGAVAAGVIIIRSLPGGLEQLLQFAEAQDKFRLFDFSTSLVKPSMTFWTGLVGGMFLTAATHGTDQMMVQRYLSAKNQRDAGRALAFSGIIVCLQFAIFLLIGIGLACYFANNPPETPFGKGSGDKVFAHFIVHHMPTGLKGITLAAVFAAAMSTLSSSLNSSATVLIKDFVLPLRKTEMSQTAQLRFGRVATALFGALQIGIALLSGALITDRSTVDGVLKIAGFASGPVLGLFMLAVFTPRVRQNSAIVGFAIGIAVLSAIALGTQLYWPWYAAVGSLVTLAAGWIVAVLRDRELED